MVSTSFAEKTWGVCRSCAVDDMQGSTVCTLFHLVFVYTDDIWFVSWTTLPCFARYAMQNYLVILPACMFAKFACILCVTSAGKFPEWMLYFASHLLHSLCKWQYCETFWQLRLQWLSRFFAEKNIWGACGSCNVDDVHTCNKCFTVCTLSHSLRSCIHYRHVIFAAWLTLPTFASRAMQMSTVE